MKQFLAILFLATFTLQAQDRVNEAESRSFDASTETMTSATGWLNYSGQWIDHLNVINRDNSDKGKKKSGASMSFEPQNFEEISTKKFSYKNKTYYVIVVKNWSGAYLYPALKQNWEERLSKTGYVIEEKEFNKLKNIDKPIEVKALRSIYISTSEYESGKFVKSAEEALEKRKSVTYVMPVMKTDKGMIRFYIPAYFPANDKYDFNHSYFETDIENFSKIYTFK